MTRKALHRRLTSARKKLAVPMTSSSLVMASPETPPRETPGQKETPVGSQLTQAAANNVPEGTDADLTEAAAATPKGAASSRITRDDKAKAVASIARAAIQARIANQDKTRAKGSALCARRRHRRQGKSKRWAR
jgi:hypothetical protein